MFTAYCIYRYPDSKVIIYTGDINASPSDIINRAQQRFDIKLPGEVEFVYLHKRPWLEPKRYPYFTLLGQSLGSIIVGIEALLLYLPGNTILFNEILGKVDGISPISVKLLSFLQNKIT